MYTAKGRLDLDSQLKQHSTLVRRLVREQLRATLGEDAVTAMPAALLPARESATSRARH